MYWSMKELVMQRMVGLLIVLIGITVESVTVYAQGTVSAINQNRGMKYEVGGGYSSISIRNAPQEAPIWVSFKLNGTPLAKMHWDWTDNNGAYDSVPGPITTGALGTWTEDWYIGELNDESHPLAPLNLNTLYFPWAPTLPQVIVYPRSDLPHLTSQVIATTCNFGNQYLRWDVGGVSVNTNSLFNFFYPGMYDLVEAATQPWIDVIGNKLEVQIEGLSPYEIFVTYNNNLHNIRADLRGLTTYEEWSC
jgi:hypothetical protein